MGVETHLAHVGRGAVDCRRLGVHGRRRRERHCARRRVGEGTVALSMRLLGVFVANVVCGGRKAVRRHCSGVGALCIRAALRRVTSSKLDGFSTAQTSDHTNVSVPTGTAKRAPGAHACKSTVFVFNLAIDQDDVASLRKFCRLGVERAIDDCFRIEYRVVREIADLSLPTSDQMLTLCRHRGDLANRFAERHQFLFSEHTGPEIGAWNQRLEDDHAAQKRGRRAATRLHRDQSTSMAALGRRRRCPRITRARQCRRGRIDSETTDRLGYPLGPLSKHMSEFSGESLGGYTSYVAVNWLRGLPLTEIQKSQAKMDFGRLVRVIYSRIQYMLPWALFGVHELIGYESKRRRINVGDGVRDLSVLAAEGVPDFDALTLVMRLDIERVDAARLAAAYQRARTETDVVGWMRGLQWERVVGIVRGQDSRRLDPDLHRLWEQLRN
jgi:hypothetical protein